MKIVLDAGTDVGMRVFRARGAELPKARTIAQGGRKLRTGFKRPFWWQREQRWSELLRSVGRGFSVLKWSAWREGVVVPCSYLTATRPRVLKQQEFSSHSSGS